MNLLLDIKEAKQIAEQYRFLIKEKLRFRPYENAVIYSIEPVLVGNDVDYKVFAKAVYKVPEMMPELTQVTEYKQVEIDLFDLIFIQRLPILFDLDDLILATE